MRRVDREKDRQFAYEVFDKAEYMTLSMIDQDMMPYATILSMARIDETIYFHTAKEGKKIDCLRANPSVCLTAAIDVVPVAERFTTEYSSITAFGKVREILDDDLKIEALRAICEKYTPENMPNFDEAIQRSLKVTGIWAITLTELTGKCKKVKRA